MATSMAITAHIAKTKWRAGPTIRLYSILMWVTAHTGVSCAQNDDPSRGMTARERCDRSDNCRLFLDGDAEGAHFAVEVGAFEAEGFGGAGDVAVALVELLEDEVAFVGFAGFEQGGELFAAG